MSTTSQTLIKAHYSQSHLCSAADREASDLVVPGAIPRGGRGRRGLGGAVGINREEGGKAQHSSEAS